MNSDNDTEQAFLLDENLEQAAEELQIEQYISFKVTLLSHALTRRMDRFLQGKYDLSLSDWRILALLDRYGESSVREIAVHAKMDKGLVSRIVARLVKADFVSSKPDPDDGRLVILSNTVKGQKLYETIQPETRQRQKALLAVLPENERRMFYTSLEKLSKFVSKDDLVE